MDFYPPVFKQEQFNCPRCGVYAKQKWYNTYYYGSTSQIPRLGVALCEHCSDYSYWYEGKMIMPDAGGVVMPNPDLPQDVIDDYNEARSVLSKSPRGAAALLRLAIQKLCLHLGESGKNINDDIARLVKKGLPVRVQQSLDIVRVVGNNAVHPGVIDLTDNYDLAVALFGLINIIADVMITEPKKVESMYASLPEGLLKAIETRDKK